MPIRDVLLQIDSYPEVTPGVAIEQAVRFTAAIGGVLSALAVEVDIKAPSNLLADHLIGLSRMAEAEEAKSRSGCKAVLAEFSRLAQAAGVLGQAIHGKAGLYGVGDYLAWHARSRDLCIVPIADSLDGQRLVAEAVVFGSGRPVLLFRPGVADLPKGDLGVVVLAWDGSRTAARAMSDSLAVMLKAREVHVLTVLGEKPEARVGLGIDAVRHLKAHDVNAIASEVQADGRRIGPVLDDFAAQCKADLLIMGAYGRSRMREFVLGGATEHMLLNPRIPLLLSH